MRRLAGASPRRRRDSPDGGWRPPLLPAPLWLTLVLVIAVVLVAAVVAALGARPGSAHAAPAPAAPRAADPRAAPSALPTATRDPAAPADAEAVTAAGASVRVLTAPGGTPVTTLANPNAFGAPLVLLVLGRQPGWYHVSVPVRPNGTTGWVDSATVTLAAVPYQITLSQSAHLATLWHNGTQVRSFPTAVGKPSTPSPDGVFFVDVIIDNTRGSQAYGPWVLGLSGFSEVYTTFGGGDAEIALHGTDEDSTVGTSASHGCFRLHNADATWLAHLVTLGTPVYVSS